MFSWLHWYVPVFLAGAFVSLLSTPLFRKLAVRVDLMDRPSEAHKGHGKATALLGGGAMYASWILCIFVGMIFVTTPFFRELTPAAARMEESLWHVWRQLSGILLGASLAVVLGLADDKFGMKAAPKFAGQFLIALVAVYMGGVRVSIFINNEFVVSLITIFWFMLMMNAINFFDNMDGLAVGTSAIAMMFFTVVAAFNGQYLIAMFGALNTGVMVGFWNYNRNPASIFMGDSGSHFLGYLLAVMSASVTYFCKDYSLSRFPILLPLFILAVPLFDTAMVVMIRTLHKKPFWIGDHNHISHRFVKMGMSRKQAVHAVHLLALILGMGVLPVLWGEFRTAAVLVAQGTLLLIFVSLLQFSAGAKDIGMTRIEAPDQKK